MRKVFIDFPFNKFSTKNHFWQIKKYLKRLFYPKYENDINSNNSILELLIVKKYVEYKKI